MFFQNAKTRGLRLIAPNLSFFFCLPVFRDGTFEELQGWWTGERFLNLTKETLLHVLKCVIALLAGADLYHVLNVVDEDFSVADMSRVENLLGGFNH